MIEVAKREISCVGPWLLVLPGPLRHHKNNTQPSQQLDVSAMNPPISVMAPAISLFSSNYNMMNKVIVFFVPCRAKERDPKGTG